MTYKIYRNSNSESDLLGSYSKRDIENSFRNDYFYEDLDETIELSLEEIIEGGYFLYEGDEYWIKEEKAEDFQAKIEEIKSNKRNYKNDNFAEIKEDEILNIVNELRNLGLQISLIGAATTNSFYVGFESCGIFKKIRISDHEASLNENFADLDFSEISELKSLILNS